MLSTGGFGAIESLIPLHPSNKPGNHLRSWTGKKVPVLNCGSDIVNTYSCAFVCAYSQRRTFSA